MSDVLAADTETFLIRPDCVAPALVCISWAAGQMAGIFKHDGDGLAGPEGTAPPPHPRDMVAAWLRSFHTAWHNGAYDLGVVAAQWPDLIPEIFDALEAGRVHDTMLREKLRDIALGEFRWRTLPDGTHEKKNYHLSDLAARRLGLVLSKGEDTWRLRYGELHGVPLKDWPFEARDYSVKDSTTTLGVFDAQEKERAEILAKYGVDVLHDEPAQVRAAFWMQLMSCWGMPLDQTRVNVLEEAITAERALLETILIDEGLVRIEYHSPRARDIALRGKEKKRTRNAKAAQDYMAMVCAELGVAPKMTGGGKSGIPSICTDAEACEDTGDEVMEAYATYSALGNVLGKDVKAMRGMGRIHARFDSLVETGRTACRGFNLQNLRVEGHTRECFVPPPGQVFCLIDLTAAELYAVAQLCVDMFGHSRLAEVLNTGKDPHVMLAATVTRQSYDEILARVKAGDPEAVNHRKVGKHANYGLWGGMGAKRFCALVKRLTHGKIILSESDATALKAAFLETWPEAPLYLGHFAKLCQGGRKATIVQRKSLRLRSGLTYSKACNDGFQGLIADLIKDAGFRVSREMYDHTRGSILLGSRIVNMPHDEIISLVPEKTAHECAMRIQEVVLTTGKEWIPDVPPTGEVYLSAYWSKKAKPVHGPDGRLVPWREEKAA